MNGFVRRMQALIHKEFLQLSRDSSSLLLGIVLPIALILIIGYGISLDIRNIPTAVVLEDASPKAQDAVSFVNGSAYFSPTYVTSFREAEQLLLDRDVRVIIDVPPDFTSKLAAGDPAGRPGRRGSGDGHVDPGLHRKRRVVVAAAAARCGQRGAHRPGSAHVV